MKKKEWTIVSALNKVLDLSKNSKLSDEFWKECKSPLDFLKKKLELTDIQIIVLSILIEAGEPQSWRQIGEYLGCTRLSIMVHSDEVEELVKKRWVRHAGAHERRGYYEGFRLTKGVIKALRHNETYQPEKIDNLSMAEFIDMLGLIIDNGDNEDFEDQTMMLETLCAANPQLPICQRALTLNENRYERSLLLHIVYDYDCFANSTDEGLTANYIDNEFPNGANLQTMMRKLADGSHILMKLGLIEHKCDDGIADVDRYLLTTTSKEELLCGHNPSCHKVHKRHVNRNLLKPYAELKAKELYFNASEQTQVDRLAELLKDENLKGIQQRLDSEGMRRGFACLLYGGPGTGKTETVYQLARRTKRDIMQVNIAGMRDKFVGESEKNIRNVFAHYRDLVKSSEVAPILFFNEADGIFGKRTEIGGTNPSVEKMDNAMQNIILQEMEDLDGILIATTNLTCNLDDAFDRRFLFKVEFNNPEPEVKAKIWTSMLHNLDPKDALTLARKYNFSGGQIENIARKRTIEYILSGKEATFEELDQFCASEYIDKNGSRKAIGFQ